MSLPETAYMQLTPDTRICRVLNGMWQVSGAHGEIDPEKAIPHMLVLHEAGFTTWDLADHYGPAEDFIGAFREIMQNKPGALANSQAFTKWVPRPGPMSRDLVEAAIDRSRERMRVDTLDMLQFHWWEYRDERYLDALKIMADMPGKIRHLSLTNFDTRHLRKITESGIKIVSNQVQYSLIDLRPEVAMVPFCLENDVKLLTYGTLCGGLLSDRYLGKPEPDSRQLTTASLRKYKQMIDVWGGWALFQELLQTLRGVADRHDSTIANVAVRYILDRPAVAGVIAGVRLGVSDHHEDNARVFDVTLDGADLDAIHAVTAKSSDLFRRIGDTGDEYRRR